MSAETQPPPPPDEPSTNRSGRGWPWWWLLAFALVGLLGGVIGAVVVKATTSSSASSTHSVCRATTVAKVGMPSVVKVLASKGQSSGTGSGEIIRDGGYILTNDHVIAVAVGSGGAVSVQYSDGETSSATIVGTDALTDLAVLKAADGFEKLPPIKLGSSADTQVGQPVIALGAPLGLASTLTAGVISALDRHVPVPSASGQTAHLVGALQTDASINPGNSGGALVDCGAKLVGVNTAIATAPDSSGQPSGGSIGLGFAIPVDLAIPIAGELIADGRATHPSIGVQVEAIPPSAAEAAGLPAGLFVVSVTAGGPGAQAGLAVGDVITKIDGADARSSAQLTVAELASRTGTKVSLTYVHDGTAKDVEIATTDSGP